MEFVNAHLIKYEPTNFLSFDDVSLMPKYSSFDSRNDSKISTSARLMTDMNLKVPILSANMDTVTASEMCIAMHNAGGMGILHRFYGKFNESTKRWEPNKSLWLDDVKRVQDYTGRVAISIGASPKDVDLVGEILKFTKTPIVLVDTAHGHLKLSLAQINLLSKTYGSNIRIIGGNVCTAQATQAIIAAGANCVKVGVGPGSNCSTRVVTGCGIPQLSAIMMARRVVSGMQSNATVIADGGIRNSGDIVKALAAGADTVMIGGLLAGTKETSGELTDQFGGSFKVPEIRPGAKKPDYSGAYKLYRGQSSAHFLEDLGREDVSAEGVHRYIPYKDISATEVIKNLVGGLRSGMSYCGASTLDKLHESATFVEISQNSHIEGTPHGR